MSRSWTRKIMCRFSGTWRTWTAGIINSRKLNIRAVITLEVKVDALCDAEAAVDVDAGGLPVEILRRNEDVAAISARRKDTFRVKENIQIPGNKPNIDRILWQEMKLQGVNTKPLDGEVHVDGELMVFVIYSGEGENMPVQWLEESIPFSGELSLPDAIEEMIPSIRVRLIHKEVEAKPTRRRDARAGGGRHSGAGHEALRGGAGQHAERHVLHQGRADSGNRGGVL